MKASKDASERFVLDAQLDVTEIERHRISHMQATALALQELVRDWTDRGSVSEVDWTRIRALEFQDAIRARQAYVKRSTAKACVLCDDFKHHVSRTLDGVTASTPY